MPSPHCVSRGFNANVAGGMGDIVFDTPDVLASLVASGGRGRHGSSYADFTAALELSHAAAHIGIGAALLRRPNVAGVGPNVEDMYYMSRSASDVIFYSLHAAVDRYWMARQHAHPATRNEFGGTQMGVRVRPTDPLAPFNRTAADTFGLPCVAYASPPRPPPAPRGRSARGRGRTSLSGDEDAVRRGRASRNRLLAAYLAANGRSAGEIERAEEALDEAAVDAAMGPPAGGDGDPRSPRTQSVTTVSIPPPLTTTTTATTPSATLSVPTATEVPAALPVPPRGRTGAVAPRPTLTAAVATTRRPAAPSTGRPRVARRRPVPPRPLVLRLPVAVTAPGRPVASRRPAVASAAATARPVAAAGGRPVTTQRPGTRPPLRPVVTRRPVAAVPAARGRSAATRRPTVSAASTVTATTAAGGAAVDVRPRLAGRGD